MANTNICQTRHPIGQWTLIIISSSYWSMVQAVDIYKIGNNKAIQTPYHALLCTLSVAYTID